MIFYFSGTGNSEHIARLIGERTGEEVIDIAKCLKESRLSFTLKKRERLGFVYPIYFWGLPSIVIDFVKAAEFTFYGKQFTYSVATCGATTGAADRNLSELLKKKHIPMHATFAIKMVDNYTPIFDVSDKEKNALTNAKASDNISDMLFLVDNRIGGYYNHYVGLWPVSKATKVAYDLSRRTAFFKVSNDCIGCGKCAENCPCTAIEMVDGKPSWTKKKCTFCLGCVNKCPANAISAGGMTRKHGQYVYIEEDK